MRKSLYYILLALAAGACTPEEQDNPFVGPTCYDGIRNQDEEEIDCGGRCQACEVLGTPVVTPCANSLKDNVVRLDGIEMTADSRNSMCQVTSQGYRLYFQQGNTQIFVVIGGNTPYKDQQVYSLVPVSFPQAGEASIEYYEGSNGPFSSEKGTLYVRVKGGKVIAEFCDITLSNVWNGTGTTYHKVSGRIRCQ